MSTTQKEIRLVSAEELNAILSEELIDLDILIKHKGNKAQIKKQESIVKLLRDQIVYIQSNPRLGYILEQIEKHEIICLKYKNYIKDIIQRYELRTNRKPTAQYIALYRNEYYKTVFNVKLAEQRIIFLNNLIVR